MLFDQPLYVLGILCLNIAISIWLERNTGLRHMGAALTVIVLTSLTANIGIIPSASNPSPVYHGIFEYIAPASIFLLLLGVNLRQLQTAGKPMLILFCIGAVGTCLGVLLSDSLMGHQFGSNAGPIAGMIAGTYTGGSINFNAVAIHYDMLREGVLYASIVAVDNIYTTLWMAVTLLLPIIMNKWIPRQGQLQRQEDGVSETFENTNLSIFSFAILSFMTVMALLVSGLVADATGIPSILILTTLALILAQFRAIHDMAEARVMGLYLVYLFLAVVGAFCELAALTTAGGLALLILGYLSIVIVVHAAIIVLGGLLLKFDWYMVSIASQANVGGSSSALALAKSLKRDDLLLAAVLTGALGNGIGTYLGFFIAGL